MDAYVYILYSAERQRFYVGYTKDLERRVTQHQRDEGRWTKGKGPWKLVYYETFDSDTAARKREIAIKRKRRTTYLRWLISEGPGTKVG